MVNLMYQLEWLQGAQVKHYLWVCLGGVSGGDEHLNLWTQEQAMGWGCRLCLRPQFNCASGWGRRTLHLIRLESHSSTNVKHLFKPRSMLGLVQLNF